MVIGDMAQALDKSRFRLLMTGEMEASILEHHMQDNAKVHIIRQPYNYVQWAKTAAVIVEYKKDKHPFPQWSTDHSQVV